jgi:hypothetical protein
MAWSGGTQTITSEFGCLKIVTTNFDANGEIGTAFDITDYDPFKSGHYLPFGRQFGLSVDQTSGTTAVVAVSIQGSLDNTTWRDIVDLTDCEATATSDAISGVAHDHDMIYCPVRYARIYVTTVGSGNTLTVTGYIRGSER